MAFEFLRRKNPEIDSVISRFEIDKINELYFNFEKHKVVTGVKFVKEAINEGWLSEDKIQRVVRENGDAALPDFLADVAFLMLEAKKHPLTDAELTEMKSNIGFISSVVMRNTLQMRKK